MISFLAIGVCFTIVSFVLIQAMASSHHVGVSPAVEPISSIVLATVGYIGFVTGWKEITITVNNLEKRFTATTRNLLTRTTKKREATFSEIQTMRGTVDEHTNSVKVTIARDNQETIQFQLDCNSYGPLEKYLKTLLPSIPVITRDNGFHEAGMLPGHISAVY
jgi:hypothetical protein